MTNTRHTRISERRLATLGAYEAEWIGTPVVWTDYDGNRHQGVVESFHGRYPIIRFPDGRWARGDLHVEVVCA